MSQYVGVDASSPHGGTDFFNVGVAVEVNDKDQFREHYFEAISTFLTEHEISVPFKVIKSRDIVNRVPSYRIRDAMSSLLQDLLRNPGFSRLNVSIGWYNEEVDLEYNDKDPMNGNTFAAKFLKQYFNVATLWQYHRSHDYNLPATAYVDEINGKITGAWQYVGNEFRVNIIPSGDVTYPVISTADIIAYSLQGILSGHPSTKFTDYPQIVEEFLVRNRDKEADLYIMADYINEADSDQIVPQHPYPIKSEVHHPHPILFVYDEVFESGDILPETDFHAYCRKWALENEGAVVTWQKDHLPVNIFDEDIVVYTEGSDSAPIKLLQNLNPTRDFTVVESSDLLADIIE